MTITPEQIERWAKALEPFAEGATHLHPAHPDNGMTLDGIEVRASRAAYAAKAEIDAILALGNQQDSPSQSYPAVAFEAGDWPAWRTMDSGFAEKLVRAVLDAEAPIPQNGYGTRSIGYYFATGLDTYRRFDEMHSPLMAAALQNVEAVLDGAERANWVGSGTSKTPSEIDRLERGDG